MEHTVYNGDIRSDTVGTEFGLKINVTSQQVDTVIRSGVDKVQSGILITVNIRTCVAVVDQSKS